MWWCEHGGSSVYRGLGWETMGSLSKTQFGQSSPSADKKIEVLLAMKGATAPLRYPWARLWISNCSHRALQWAGNSFGAFLFIHMTKRDVRVKKKEKEHGDKLSGFMGKISEDNSFCLPSWILLTHLAESAHICLKIVVFALSQSQCVR